LKISSIVGSLLSCFCSGRREQDKSRREGGDRAAPVEMDSAGGELALPLTVVLTCGSPYGFRLTEGLRANNLLVFDKVGVYLLLYKCAVIFLHPPP